MVAPVLWLLVVAQVDASSAVVVSPFRTEAAPRIDPVFGNAAGLRASIDQFLALQGEMEKVREEFSSAVHRTLVQLGPIGPDRPARTCPTTVATPYGSALEAG